MMREMPEGAGIGIGAGVGLVLWCVIIAAIALSPDWLIQAAVKGFMLGVSFYVLVCLLAEVNR